MSIDQRVRETLDAAASEVPDRSRRDIEIVKQQGRKRARRRQVAWSTGASVGVVAFVVGFGLFSGEEPVPSAGLIRTDPPVIQAEFGPEPMFDTSALGEDVTLVPFDPQDEVIDQILDLPPDEILQVILLGYRPNGGPVWIHHATDGVLQTRCLFADFGGGCVGEPVAVAQEYPNGLLPADPRLEPASYGTGGLRASFEWELPLDVSVAMLSFGDTRLWQRPIGGVAAFEVEGMSLAERYQLTLFDQDGDEIDRYVKVSNERGFVCPITVPQTISFVQPDGYPDAAIGQGWFGSAGLWTTLPIDGVYEPRKSVWWSANFPGGETEQEPEIAVTWTRLDAQEPVIAEFPGTNAFTEEDGWFMIAGIDPQGPGCWEVRASYKDSTVRYVYENR